MSGVTLSQFLDHPPDTAFYAVLGNPVEQSLSPLIHGLAFDMHQLPFEFHKIQVDDVRRLSELLHLEGFMGASVTIPLKKSIIQHLNYVDPAAKKMNAVNCIVKHQGKSSGYNTDTTGFSYPIKEFQNILSGKKALVFGTGGASEAVQYALNQMGVSEVIRVSRDKRGPNFTSYQTWTTHATASGIIVNTTPIGMYPDVNVSPVEDKDIGFLTGKICYDIVYKPMQTKFLRQAESVGSRTIGGLEMFIRQGEAAFMKWTGLTFPVEQVRTLLIAKLHA